MLPPPVSYVWLPSLYTWYVRSSWTPWKKKRRISSPTLRSSAHFSRFAVLLCVSFCVFLFCFVSFLLLNAFKKLKFCCCLLFCFLVFFSCPFSRFTWRAASRTSPCSGWWPSSCQGSGWASRGRSWRPRTTSPSSRPTSASAPCCRWSILESNLSIYETNRTTAVILTLTLSQ